jgi:hypothetical protein
VSALLPVFVLALGALGLFGPVIAGAYLAVRLNGRGRGAAAPPEGQELSSH